MIVLAEGVETQQQLRRLRRLGCELGQGFLFSPAVPAHEVESIIDWVLDEPEDAPTGVPVL
jgi:EAL domain-containing protein (putative c-di-GMP-specific phosphodiesterase class I)